MSTPPVTLSPCVACARHVRGDARACPFCGAPRVARRDEGASRFPRVSRAVLFAAGATLGLEGCDGALVSTAHAEGFDAVSMVPQYGAPSDWVRRPPREPPEADAGAPVVDAGAPARPEAPRPPAHRDRHPS